MPPPLKECQQILKQFIGSKPGLLSFFPDFTLDDYATRAAGMISKLVSDGCSPGMAAQLAVLVLYDLVLLVGKFTTTSRHSRLFLKDDLTSPPPPFSNQTTVAPW